MTFIKPSGCLSVPHEHDPFLHNSNRVSRTPPIANREVLLNSWIIWFLLLAPVITLLIWLSVALPCGVKINFESSALGGKLTQTQAKAIDVLCSVVFAPFLVAAFDYFWFNAMRVVALNEQTLAMGAPIQALATACSADSGSYNALKTWTFVRTKRGVLQAFAFLLLFSAAAKSLLANIIAYEAFEVITVVETSGFKSLVNPIIDPSDSSDLCPYREFRKLNFSESQQEEFASQQASTLMELSYRSA